MVAVMMMGAVSAWGAYVPQDNVDIDGGAIDGTQIGASSATDATFTDVNVTSQITGQIGGTTAKDATFLVDPTLSDFYIRAERAVFVSLKHVPSAGPDIVEWYERIKLTNNHQPPSGPSFDSVSQLRANSNL